MLFAIEVLAVVLALVSTSTAAAMFVDVVEANVVI
jgi:hypothetical protein